MSMVWQAIGERHGANTDSYRSGFATGFAADLPISRQALCRKQTCSAPASSEVMMGQCTTSEIPEATSALAPRSSADAAASRIGRCGAISRNCEARSSAAVAGAI